MSDTPATHHTHSVHTFSPFHCASHLLYTQLTQFPILNISLSGTPATHRTHSVPPTFSQFHCPSQLLHTANTLSLHSQFFTVLHTCHTPHSLSSHILAISLSVTPATHPTRSVHSILNISLTVKTATRPTLSVPLFHHFTVRHTCHTPSSFSSHILTI